MERLIDGLKKAPFVMLVTLTAWGVTSNQSSFAQGQSGARVQKGPLEHATWYTANPEIQIIDNRPIIKDFREAPPPPQKIQLPDAPAGYNPNFKQEGPPLPKSGFGQSNISSGVAPRNLPGVGRSSAPKVALPLKARGQLLKANNAPSKTVSNKPVSVATYNHNYNAASGPSSGNSDRTSTNLRGTLLRH